MRRSEEELQKHTMSLYAGDFMRLRELYPELGAAIVIRRLIRNHLKSLTPETKIKNIEVDL